MIFRSSATRMDLAHAPEHQLLAADDAQEQPPLLLIVLSADVLGIQREGPSGWQRRLPARLRTICMGVIGRGDRNPPSKLCVDGQ
jgi:uncharacterized protein (DUF4415 family)